MGHAQSVERSAPRPNGTYELLREQIVDGRIPPGTRLNIEAISRKLGVSQTPIREALNQLRGDGLVLASSGKGYSTTALLTLDELRDLFEFRLLIEPWAARAVAVHRITNPASGLTDELKSFGDQLNDGQDVRLSLVRHDTSFHQQILDATGNQTVNYVYGKTHCHLHLFRLYPSDTDGSYTISEHQAVCDAIKNRDPDGAEEAMYQHLIRAYGRYTQAFEGSGTRPAPLRESPSRTQLSK